MIRKLFSEGGEGCGCSKSREHDGENPGSHWVQGPDEEEGVTGPNLENTVLIEAATFNMGTDQPVSKIILSKKITHYATHYSIRNACIFYIIYNTNCNS